MTVIISDFIEYPDKIAYSNIKNKFDNINMLANVSAGKIKKLKLKRPLSSDSATQDAILAYLEHYDVEVILEY